MSPLSRPPILCVVTDRRRLSPDPVRDDRCESARSESARLESARLDLLLAQIEEAAAADLDLVQIREPDLPAAVLLDLVTRAVALVRGSRTRVVVNDRLDVALAAGAHGVHLRGTSVDASRIRAAISAGSAVFAGPAGPAGPVAAAAVPDFLVGRSVHGVDEAAAVEAAGGLDYLILGTMFPTTSKPASLPLAGPAALHATTRACRLPILAIGGITLDRIPEIARTGAAGIAAIGLFLGSHAAAPGPSAPRPRPLRDLATEIRRAFADVPSP